MYGIILIKSSFKNNFSWNKLPINTNKHEKMYNINIMIWNKQNKNIFTCYTCYQKKIRSYL